MNKSTYEHFYYNAYRAYNKAQNEQFKEYWFGVMKYFESKF